MTLVTIATKLGQKRYAHATRREPIVTAAAEPGGLIHRNLEPVALTFLSSEFARHTHCDRPVGQQLAAYLLHHGINLVDDTLLYEALLQCVVAQLNQPLRREMAALG
jgi:hypothetical protein